MQKDAIYKKKTKQKNSPDISANFSIHMHREVYIKHKTTLLHQTKGLSGLTLGLLMCPQWMPKEINKTRTNMYDISLTYSPCFWLLNIQRLPSWLDPMLFLTSDSFTELSSSLELSASMISCAEVSWSQPTFEGNSYCFAVMGAGTLLFHSMHPHSCAENWFFFNSAKVFSVSHLNLVTPWQ